MDLCYKNEMVFFNEKHSKSQQQLFCISAYESLNEKLISMENRILGNK
jgi:hypothetical protein